MRIDALRRSLAMALVLLFVAVFAAAQQPAASQPAKLRWWKGNTHTHTLWSDGDAAPEWIAKWYKDKGYNFLVLSDHNLLLEGEKWFPVSDAPKSRLTAARLLDLEKTFGAAAVTVRGPETKREMRLLTLKELRGRFEEVDRFHFIQGQEITDAWGVKPVHINGINLKEPIAPYKKGVDVRETMNKNVDAVIEQGKRLGMPVFAHINHPNFGWGLTWEDVAHVANDRFFEVYNGHSGVRNHGDETHESTERIWDLALVLRLTQLKFGILYGVATDDSHSYFTWGIGQTNPGRGWVMVRSIELSGDRIVEAMKRGDFYASSGVLLKDIRVNPKRYEIEIEAVEGVGHKTRFIGTRTVGGKVGEAGEILFETEANPATYEYKGDELYIRAVVTSTQSHPNPYAKGDFEVAWTQPYVR